MKRLVTALTLGLAAVAFAEDPAQSDKARQQKAEQQQDEKAIEATDVGDQLREGSREWARQAGLTGDEAKDKKKEQALFKSGTAFSVNGKVKGKPGGEIELARTGDLPSVKLDVKDKTTVKLDGRKVEAKYIPEGAQVRAKFQVDGDDLLAVSIDATSPKGQQGVGGAGEEGQEQQRQQEEQQREQEQQQREQQQGTGGSGDQNEGLIGAEEVGPKAREAAEDVGQSAEDAAEDTKDAVDPE